MLFDDIFEVKNVDRDGKIFDKVSRINCSSETYEVELNLDINSDIYKVTTGTKLKVVLTSSLNQDGTEQSYYDSTVKPALLDKFDYAMYGKVFKYELDRGSSKVSVYASFGGLLMMLKGDQRNLSGFEMDLKFYLLMKKI